MSSIPWYSVVSNTLRAVEAFRDMGCKVEEVQVPWTEESASAAWTYLLHLFGASCSDYLEKGKRVLLTDYARAFIEHGRKSKATDFVTSLATAADMYEYFGDMMRGFDVFICPTLAKPALKADASLDYASWKADGKIIPDALAWCMTYPFNMLSRCPVLSVPSGFAKNGVPTGIQIVGRAYEDASVFRAATAFERAMPWAYDSPKNRPTPRKK